MSYPLEQSLLAKVKLHCKDCDYVETIYEFPLVISDLNAWRFWLCPKCHNYSIVSEVSIVKIE